MTDSTDFTPNVDALLAHNATYRDTAHDPALVVEPQRRLAIVACMDARLDVMSAFGLRNGEAHIIRNGGGVVTDDVIRSLTLSQRALGTREIILVHHTDCGLQKVNEAEFRADLAADVGVTPSWSVEGFADPYDDIRQSIERLRLSPFLVHKDEIHGFVYDVADGEMKRVDAP